MKFPLQLVLSQPPPCSVFASDWTKCVFHLLVLAADGTDLVPGASSVGQGVGACGEGGSWCWTATRPPCFSSLCSDTFNHSVSDVSAVKTEKERLQIYRFTHPHPHPTPSSSSVMAQTVSLSVIVFLHFGDFQNDLLGLTASVQTAHEPAPGC